MENKTEERASYDVANSELSDGIDNLLEEFPTGAERELVREILVTGFKLAEDGAARGDLKILRTAVKEMRHAFRVFAQYRDSRKVSVFGSARTQPGQPEYEVARDLGRILAEAGYLVITGAGDGIMGAAHKGAGRERSMGLNIQLPFEQKANPTILGDPKLINFRYFFTRKLFFVKESDAIILMPGGFGTLDEGFETMTLLQTGRAEPKPVILLDSEHGHYWERMMDFIRGGLLDGGYISPEDLSLVQLAHGPEQAADLIRRFYRRYHSLRYVDNRRLLVIRMTSPIPERSLDSLNDRFRDIVVEDRIEVVAPQPEESDDHGLESLPRLAFRFNSFNFGRLRQLIDAINDL
jgi:uncharacterized protein (TIGR00730 family)